MEFYAPQFNPAPDILKSYLQGATLQNALTQSNQATQLQAQQIQGNALNLQREQLQAGVMKRYLDELNGQQQGAQNQTGGNSGGIQNGPQASVSAQTSQPNGWTPTAANIFTPQVSPGTMQALSMVNPDAVKAMMEAQKTQLSSAQMHALDPNGGSVLPTLIGLANDPNAAQALKNNPQLLQNWEIAARSAGVDPAKLFSDKPGEADYAVKTVAYQMASPTLQQLGLQDRIKRPEFSQTVNGPLGSVYQQDSDTGKLTQVKSEESLHPVVGDNGQPQLLPASQATGRKPYNQMTYSTDAMAGPAGALDAALSSSGISLPGAGRGGQLYVSKLQNLINANPDKTPQEIADMVRTGQLDFNGTKRSTGQLATVVAASNAQTLQLEKNFNSMQPLVDKLPGGPSAVNRLMTNLQNNWSFGGDKDSAALVTYMKSVAGEYAKLASGSTGAAAPAEGQLTDAMRIMQNAYTKGGFEGIKEALLTEAHNKQASYREGLAAASQRGAATGGGAPAPSSGTVTLYKNGIPHNIPADKADDARKNYGYSDRP